MLKAGRIQTLTVSRVSEYGLYLADEEQNEVLLPNRYTSLTDKVGDRKEVFLYHDSEDRLVATTETPLLREGEAGYLRVVDMTAHGAFLDWGLHGKDLFLPNRNQQGGILAGHSYIVYLYEDNITGRCVATTKLKSFINNDLITVKPREEVSLLVASESEIGFRVIVNNRHWGMIYRNQIFRPVAVGDRLKGYVRRITEDNRIDVSLQQTGFAQVKDSAEVLLVFPPTMVLAEVQPASAESESRPASANAQSFLSFIWFYPFVLYKNRENFGGFCCRHALNIAHGFTKIKKHTAN